MTSFYEELTDTFSNTTYSKIIWRVSKTGTGIHVSVIHLMKLVTAHLYREIAKNFVKIIVFRSLMFGPSDALIDLKFARCYFRFVDFLTFYLCSKI